MFNHTELEHYIKDLEHNMPKIEGVEWTVLIDRICTSPGFQVRVVASFTTMTEDLIEEFLFIGSKLHEITANGQIKLELE